MGTRYVDFACSIAVTIHICARRTGLASTWIPLFSLTSFDFFFRHIFGSFWFEGVQLQRWASPVGVGRKRLCGQRGLPPGGAARIPSHLSESTWGEPRAWQSGAGPGSLEKAEISETSAETVSSKHVQNWAHLYTSLIRIIWCDFEVFNYVILWGWACQQFDPGELGEGQCCGCRCGVWLGGRGRRSGSCHWSPVRCQQWPHQPEPHREWLRLHTWWHQHLRSHHQANSFQSDQRHQRQVEDALLLTNTHDVRVCRRGGLARRGSGWAGGECRPSMAQGIPSGQTCRGGRAPIQCWCHSGSNFPAIADLELDQATELKFRQNVYSFRTIWDILGASLGHPWLQMSWNFVLRVTTRSQGVPGFF